MEGRESTSTHNSALNIQSATLSTFSGDLFDSMIFDWDFDCIGNPNVASPVAFDEWPNHDREISSFVERNNLMLSIGTLDVTNHDEGRKDGSVPLGGEDGEETTKPHLTELPILVPLGPPAESMTRKTSIYFDRSMNRAAEELESESRGAGLQSIGWQSGQAATGDNGTRLKKDKSTNTENEPSGCSSIVQQNLERIVAEVSKIQQSITSLVAKHMIVISCIEDGAKKYAAHKWFLNHELFKVYYKKVPLALKLVKGYLSEASEWDTFRKKFREAVTSNSSNDVVAEDDMKCEDTAIETEFILELKANKDTRIDPGIVFSEATKELGSNFREVSVAGIDLRVIFSSNHARGKAIRALRDYVYNGFPVKKLYALYLDARSKYVYETDAFDARVFEALPFQFGGRINYALAAEVLSNRNRQWFEGPEEIVNVECISLRRKSASYILTLHVSKLAWNKIQSCVNGEPKLNVVVASLCIRPLEKKDMTCNRQEIKMSQEGEEGNRRGGDFNPATRVISQSQIHLLKRVAEEDREEESRKRFASPRP